MFPMNGIMKIWVGLASYLKRINGQNISCFVTLFLILANHELVLDWSTFERLY